MNAVEPEKTHVTKELKHDRPLTACRFDPTGKYAFTGAEDNFVVRWDLESGAATKLEGHDSWVRAFAFSPSGDTVYTGGFDGRILSWSATAEKPTPAVKLDAHSGWVRALAVSLDGSRLASCGNDNLVKLWDTADGKLISELRGHESHVYNLAFHPFDGSLVSCDLKGNAKHWDVSTGSVTREFTYTALHVYDKTFRADIGGARGMAFSRDGKQLALSGITNCTNAFAGIGNPAVLVLDWETGKLAVQYEGKEKINGVAWGVRQHPDGFWIGLSGGGGGGWLYFWKDTTAQEFAKIKLPDSGRDFDLHPDSIRVAIAHPDKNLRICELRAKPT